jgi:hypothetical protein
MNLYLLTSDASGYDTYNSCVVAATDEESAKRIHPSYGIVRVFDDYCVCENGIRIQSDSWSMYSVKAKLIGTTYMYEDGSVVIASFNAG